MEYETRLTDDKNKVMVFKSSSLKRAMSMALDFYIFVGEKNGFVPFIKLKAFDYEVLYVILKDKKGEYYYE